MTTSALRNKWLSGEESSDWRELSLSTVREQPMTVWPLLASSRARALPSPLLTPVISTVRDLLAPTPFIPLYDVVIHTRDTLYIRLCGSLFEEKQNLGVGDKAFR